MFSTVVMFCSINTFCILSLNIVCRSNKGFMPDFFFFLLVFMGSTTNTDFTGSNAQRVAYETKLTIRISLCS